MDCTQSGLSVHGILQARILRVGCHAFLQGIFQPLGLNYAEISQSSLFIFLPRSGLFVYPKFQPPWDNRAGSTLFQNFTVWGSAGGAQVCFFNFFKVRNVIHFLILHLYLKGDDLFLGEDCYIITALRSQQHHRCVCQIVVE